MKHFYFGRRTLFSLSLLSAFVTASAGNIPQYSVAKGDASAKYAEFSDGTVIPCSWSTGTYALLPDGTTNPNVTIAQGYPIGFDFRFGGRTVNQFIPSNTGKIYLGKDAVTYGNGCFCLSMSPVMHGLKAGQISYKVTGDVGNRILILQWKDATLNTSSGYVGKYSLQYRLYEKDGKIEMAFKEIETPSSSNGFDTSIHGWDGRDAVVLTAAGLDRRMSVSENFSADMLSPSTYVKWDEDDYDNGYSPVFVFIPESDTTPPVYAPTGLEVVQNGENLDISCVRGSDADATVILISTEPFTEADMPVDGSTFQASYVDTNGKQWHPTQIGNAIPLTYINDSDISTIFKGVESGKTYYIRAVSANGYPAYNRSEVAEVVFSTSQAAPTGFDGTAFGNGVLLQWSARDRVIIAATTERQPGYGVGYAGLFGTPASDAVPGDLIEGGGEVIYSGDDGLFMADTEPNTMTYFRAWTVRDGRLSATAADCASAPLPTYPYAPAIEDYPTGSEIKGWTVRSASDNTYTPYVREAAGDNTVRAVSVNGNRLTLATPALPLDVPLRVTFDYAIETLRSAEASEDSGSVALPKGYKPGEFGDGSLDLIAGDAVVKSVNSYNGTMTTFAADEYVTGTSTFETFTVEIPAVGGSGSLEISFAGDSENTTTLYMRGFTVECLAEAPGAPAALNACFNELTNSIDITATRNENAVSTMILVSEGSFDGTVEDGRIYKVGECIGNAVVAYNGEDTEITVSHPLDTDPKDMTVTAYSHTYGLYSSDNRTVMLTLTGIDSVASDSMSDKSGIYNVTGVRLHVSSLSELPSGIYIVDGKKIVVK